jgi:hypothetical protein
MFNAGAQAVTFVLPPSGARPWRLVVDTACPSSQDLSEASEGIVRDDQADQCINAQSGVILSAQTRMG